MRPDRRRDGQLRPVRLRRGCLAFAEGSCFLRQGRTWVLCAATVEESVPPFLVGRNSGWVTAEYNMLPRATRTRTERVGGGGRLPGRSAEIQRMIGRALRAATDLEALAGLTVRIDCDVVQADGGTRAASVTAGYVALAEALEGLRKSGRLARRALRDHVAAVSVGIVGGRFCLDLSSEEDARAQVDLTLAMTGRGEIVEVQATAEGLPFGRADLDRLLNLGAKGIRELVRAQKQVLRTGTGGSS
jgi:ribonuclease PH